MVMNNLCSEKDFQVFGREFVANECPFSLETTYNMTIEGAVEDSSFYRFRCLSM